MGEVTAGRANPLLAFVVSFMGRTCQIDLIAALRQGRAEDARAIMRSHMETPETLMQAQEAQVLCRFIVE